MNKSIIEAATRRVERVVREELSHLSEREIMAINNDISFWKDLSYSCLLNSLSKLKRILSLIDELKSEDKDLYVFLSYHFQVRGVQRFSDEEMLQLKCAIKRAYKYVEGKEGKIRYLDKDSKLVIVLSKTGSNGMDLVTCYKELETKSKKSLSKNSKPKSKAYYKRLKKLKEAE